VRVRELIFCFSDVQCDEASAARYRLVPLFLMYGGTLGVGVSGCIAHRLQIKPGQEDLTG